MFFSAGPAGPIFPYHLHRMGFLGISADPGMAQAAGQESWLSVFSGLVRQTHTVALPWTQDLLVTFLE